MIGRAHATEECYLIRKYCSSNNSNAYNTTTASSIPVSTTKTTTVTTKITTALSLLHLPIRSLLPSRACSPCPFCRVLAWPVGVGTRVAEVGPETLAGLVHCTLPSYLLRSFLLYYTCFRSVARGAGGPGTAYTLRLIPLFKIACVPHTLTLFV